MNVSRSHVKLTARMVLQNCLVLRLKVLIAFNTRAYRHQCHVFFIDCYFFRPFIRINTVRPVVYCHQLLIPPDSGNTKIRAPFAKILNISSW